jgi:hypothetical protein
VSISATVDFPAPIPPVKPTNSTVEDSTGRLHPAGAHGKDR